MSPESNTCISKNLKQFWSEIRPSVIRWIANIGKFFGLRDTDFANYLPFFFRFFQGTRHFDDAAPCVFRREIALRASHRG